MTEILDSQGNEIRVGTVIHDGADYATVLAISEPDGDTNSYGQTVGILPRVTVRYHNDGVVSSHLAHWNATGPWDDHRDDYTCDDLIVETMRSPSLYTDAYHEAHGDDR